LATANPARADQIKSESGSGVCASVTEPPPPEDWEFAVPELPVEPLPVVYALTPAVWGMSCGGVEVL